MSTISENHQYKKGREFFRNGKTYSEVLTIASTYKMRPRSLIMAGWHDADQRAGNSFR